MRVHERKTMNDNEQNTPASPEESSATATEQATAVSGAPDEPEAVTSIGGAVETQPAPKRGSTGSDGHWWWGVGRRKAAVARVRIKPGNGAFIVNKRDMKTYFTEERDHKDLLNVLEKTKTKGSVDVYVNVRGGGYTGQAGAILLGLGRALKKFDQSLEPILRDENFLTRDPRKVERKKYGQPGARKRFQFSKR